MTYTARATAVGMRRERHNDKSRRRVMNIDDLTPEQKEKVLACKTPEELLALAKQ